MNQPLIPELSLIGQQQHEQEQELGQRLAHVCRGVGRSSRRLPGTSHTNLESWRQELHFGV